MGVNWFRTLVTANYRVDVLCENVRERKMLEKEPQVCR
jgi:hypothetical protein